jgi:hypothetical protein
MGVSRYISSCERYLPSPCLLSLVENTNSLIFVCIVMTLYSGSILHYPCDIKVLVEVLYMVHDIYGVSAEVDLIICSCICKTKWYVRSCPDTTWWARYCSTNLGRHLEDTKVDMELCFLSLLTMLSSTKWFPQQLYIT